VRETSLTYVVYISAYHGVSFLRDVVF